MDWTILIAMMDGAYAPSTIKSYRTDFAAFAEWCAANDHETLPATPETVAAYIDDRSQTLKATTLKRHMCAIRKLHRLADLPVPTESETVLLALRRARRKRPGRPVQAFGLTAAYRDRLMFACGDDITGERDRVLMALGFDTLCRRSELVALRVQDLRYRQNGRVSILVRRAKNDQTGEGRIAHLSADTVALLDRWLEKIDMDRGPILRPVYKDRLIPRHLAPLTVSRVLKKLADRAGLGKEDLRSAVSGHSLRVGGAQELNIRGHDILTIMRAGGWRSMNVVARYVEHVGTNPWR